MAKPTEIPGLGSRTSLRAAGSKLLAVRLADVRAHERKVNGKIGSQAIHDMRVATRRLRAALSLFGDARLARLEGEVKRLQDALGRVRDGQVQVEWIDSMATGLGTESIAALGRAQKKALASRKRELRAELARWGRKGVPALSQHLSRAGGKGRLGGKGMRRRLLERFSKLQRQADDFRESLDAQTAHALRIHLKKLRYELELLSPGFPTGASATLAILIPLQDKLGALHDSDVRLELLAKFAARTQQKHKPHILKLAERVLQVRRQQTAEVGKQVERWKAENTLQQLTRLFQ